MRASETRDSKHEEGGVFVSDVVLRDGYGNVVMRFPNKKKEKQKEALKDE